MDKDLKDKIHKVTERKPPKPRFTWRRPSPARIVIWFVELAVLLIFAQYFFINPRLAKSRQQELERAAKRKRQLEMQQSPPVPVLGQKARSIPHLTEVVDARLASLQSLADGSSGAQETQVFIATEQHLPVEVENSVGIRFRLIPPGPFLMGSPEVEEGRWEGEEQHVAAIPEPFYISKYEVTQEQWLKVTGENPAYFRNPRRPVEEVTWYDCQKFTLALSEMENLPPGTYRLPTEAEWEYACRAGTGSAFYFGDDPARLDAFAIYANNTNDKTVIVGTKRPNAYGLYNMHGNVWEWCLDKFTGYKDFEIDPEKADWRVVRGGNWREPAENCRSANRARLPPMSHGNILGLRLVRTIPSQQKQEQEQ